MQGRVLTIPNLLTSLRLVMLIPIFYALVHENRTEAFIWMIVSIVTDNLDGFIARKFNQMSDLGRILDPAVDKICIVSVSTFLALTAAYDFPLWFFLFIGIREILVLIGGSILVRKTKIVPQSRRPGKLSAFFTGLAILLYIPGWQPFAFILLLVATAFTLISTWDYVQYFRRASLKP